MFDDETSPDGHWRIRWELKKDFAAYFESETQWHVHVIHGADEEAPRDVLPR